MDEETVCMDEETVCACPFPPISDMGALPSSLLPCLPPSLNSLVTVSLVSRCHRDAGEDRDG
eukprot:3939447-Rhodomonas_salina.1